MAYFSKSGTDNQIWYCAVTLILFASVGICRSYSAFLFHQLDSHDSKIILNNDEKTWIGSSLGFFSPLGGLLAGVLSDALGRKSNILCMSVPFLVSWLVISFATSYQVLLTGILIQGCGVGLCLCVITYLTEISSTKFRGIMLSLVVVAFNLGVTICNSLMYFFEWNTVSLIFSGFSVCSFFLALLLPESPVWLYSKGATEKATTVLRLIIDPASEEFANELQEMKKSFAKGATTTEKMGILGIARNCRRSWKQMAILMGFTVVMFHSGQHTLLAYTVIIVSNLQIPFNAAKVALCYSIVSIIGSFLTPFFFHNLNRKPTLAISTFGMGVSMITIAVYEELFLHQEEKPCAWIVPLALFAFVSFSNVAIIPLGFVIGGEILPAEGRGILFGTGSCFTSVYYILTLKLYPRVLFGFGIKALIWSFGVNCFVVTLFAVFVLPETRGKTLSQVQEQYFGEKKTKTGEVPDSHGWDNVLLEGTSS